jgi:signal transduction histidine kinase
MISRTRLVYGLLLAVWILVVAWQAAEHDRVKKAARTTLINRSRDITTTLGVVIRSQRFRGVVLQERLEPALKELVKSGELNAVALLSATGAVVASAGGPIDFETKGMLQNGEHWDYKNVTLVNLVDLGASERNEGETNRPPIVVLPPGPPREPGAPRDRMRPNDLASTNGTPLNLSSNNASTNFAVGPLQIASSNAVPPRSGDQAATNLAGPPPPPNPGDRRPRRFGRPFGMSEQEYKSLLETRGLHGLVIALSTENFRRAVAQDLWMRCIISCFAGVSVAGLGLAWRNLTKTSELQMRLLRASELNTHLKEMNLAAAGLAHETRNPLNIIRGLAQMVSKQEETAPEIRRKLCDIVNETDRVTAQLNEFINYSRPREVRRSAVPLSSVIGEVGRALNFDLEEKSIVLQTSGEQLHVEADEQLLRQALFNLLLNAIQAVEKNGEILISATRSGASEASLEVRDNGSGVPEQQRAEVFKPYFTTHEKGTGLGLAVVQQIVLAHGWEVECLPNTPTGAIFRITHLKLTA